MKVADIPGVLRVNAAGRPGVTPLDAPELQRLLALSPRHLVAEADGDGVAGYLLAFSRRSAYDGEEFAVLRRRLPVPFLYVDQVAVAPETRRRGLGRLLYAALEADALAAGISTLCCEVNTVPANPASLALHADLGFRGAGPLATRDGRRVTLLVRDLVPAATP